MRELAQIPRPIEELGVDETIGTPPERRAAALEIASRARAGRKETKEKLAAGEIALAEVVESEDEAIRRMRVIDLIKAMPGYGPAKAATTMEECGITESRRIRGLGKLQKEKLLDVYPSLH